MQLFVDDFIGFIMTLLVEWIFEPVVNVAFWSLLDYFMKNIFVGLLITGHDNDGKSKPKN